MPPAPWQAAADILAGGGLEALGRSVVAAEGSETVRQVVFGKYPQLAIGAKNYLVGLTNSFLNAGMLASASVSDRPLSDSFIPVNPGLGGVGGAVNRYIYTVYVDRTDAQGNYLGGIKVDVKSSLALGTPNIEGAAEAQVAAWAAKYPDLARWLNEHPVPAGTTIIGVQRAF